MKTDLIVSKIDRRTKEGKVVVLEITVDIAEASVKVFELLAKFDDKKYTIEKRDWVQRKNLMTKQLYWEPANTPAFCSPSRESYWAM